MPNQPMSDVPVHPELFFGTDYGPTARLAGARCAKCGELFFPRRLACPRCRSAAEMATECLPELGVVYAFTYVARPAALYQEPYLLALVDLDEGPRILAQVKASPDELRIGARVRLLVEPLFETGEGQRVWGYRCEPNG
jgi:uncharacterized OB-fold protein